ncbi:MAG TPA: hypothetical protein VMW91_05905, partial [Desulfosporosinus sp.]|nr:hypothetical protein [Desulfosporosinus sp.]
MTSLDLQCVSVVSLVCDCILRDEHWQAFGYHKRPRLGKLWEFFNSKQMVNQKKVLMREFWAAAFGVVFYWALNKKKFKHRSYFIAKTMYLCINSFDEKPLWPTFQFQAPNEAFKFLQQACRDYGSSKEFSDLGGVFLQRSISYLDEKLPSIWIQGAAWLFGSVDSMFRTIIVALDDTVGQNRDLDIRIGGANYPNASIAGGYLE